MTASKLSPRAINIIIQMHKSGMPISDIAGEFGVSLVTMKRRIAEIRQKHDLPYRTKSTQKTRMDRAEHSAEQSPWNLELGHKYITTEWKVA